MYKVVKEAEPVGRKRDYLLGISLKLTRFSFINFVLPTYKLLTKKFEILTTLCVLIECSADKLIAVMLVKQQCIIQNFIV